MGTLESQSFTNDAANSGGLFFADKRPVEQGSAARGMLTISYDATKQSYTVTTAGRSAVFTQDDAVASGSAALLSFEKTGATSEALTFTRPGTSGQLTYKYVSGGAWERGAIDGNKLTFTYDPFTYGIQTPANQLPVNGTGRYAVSLVGARAMDTRYAVAGSGDLQIDFMKGALSSTGVLTSIDVATGLLKGAGVFFGEAQLTSGSSAFTGQFSMYDGKRFTGGWDGRFYGPAGEEVGAAWYLTSADGEAAAGYMVGRQDAAAAGWNMALNALQFDDSFAQRFSQLKFNDSGNGTAAKDSVLYRSEATLNYNAAQASYQYVDSRNEIDLVFAAANLDPVASNSSLAVYRVNGADGLSYSLSLNKAGAANTTIALTYASFGRWQQAQAPGADRIDRWFAWGIRTNGFQIPTGSGTFAGIIRGTATTINGGPTYNLSGTSNFAVNFGAGSFTGSLNPIGTSNVDQSQRNFGSFTFDRGTIDLDAGLTANIVNGASDYLGFFEGALFGPKATEIGGSFGFQTQAGDPSGSSSAAYLSGVTVGTRTDN